MEIGNIHVEGSINSIMFDINKLLDNEVDNDVSIESGRMSMPDILIDCVVREAILLNVPTLVDSSLSNWWCRI